MKSLNKFFSLFACLALLANCAKPTIDDSLNDLQSYNQDFREKNINVFLKSFSDHRQGKALVKPTGEGVVYSYIPNDLTNGSTMPRLGFYVNKTLDKHTSNPNAVGIDVSIRDIKTLIRTGDFTSGRYGYYSVEVSAKVILRNMYDLTVIDSFNVDVDENKARTTATGYQPDAAKDEQALLDLLDEVAYKLADEILHKTDSILNKEDYQVTGFSSLEVEDVAPKAVEMPEPAAVTNEEVMVQPVAMPEPIENTENDDLEVTPEMIEAIEAEEKGLLEHKDLERQMYEKKLLEQKWLDHLDKQQ